MRTATACGTARLTGLKPEDYALETGGEAVRLFYSRWQHKAKTGTD